QRGMQSRQSATALESADEPDDDEEDHRPDGGGDDLWRPASPQVDAQPGEQPTADERAQDAYDYVPEQAQALAFDDLAGGPAGDEPDEEGYGQTLERHDVQILSRSRNGWRSRWSLLQRLGPRLRPGIHPLD